MEKEMDKFLYRDVSPYEAAKPLKIDEIKIKWLESSDRPNFLGVYSNVHEEGAIEVRHSAMWKYFLSATYDPDYPEHAKQDYNRYRAFELGKWSLEGCVAKATVSYPIDGSNRRLEHFTSGGLWGIESDSEASYKLEVEIEQLEDLKRHVEVFKIPWTDREETVLVSATAQLQSLRSKKRCKTT